MRKLMWFTIGFGFSCGICSYGMLSAWVLPMAMGAVLLGVAAVCIIRRRESLLPAAVVLMGCVVGIFWFAGFWRLYVHSAAQLDGEEAPLSVTASDYGRITDYGTSMDGWVSIGGKPYQIRISLDTQTSIAPGDRVEGSFRLRLTVPDETGDSTWYQGKGIFLLGHQVGETAVIPAAESPKWFHPALLRQRVLRILEHYFPSDTAPFVKALLLGDSRELDYATDTAFKVSGIRHIIAVSGLHISILYSLICVFTLRRRFLTAAVGMPVLLLFAAVAGFTPSVTRACIMVGLMMLAMVFDREYDPATALSFAVLVMLVANPLSVTSVSLQLSVGCVAGILLFNQPVYQWLKEKNPRKKGMAAKIWNGVSSSTAVTLSAMSLITPLSAYYFGAVSLVSVLTNLLTLWAVNLIFNGLVTLCLLHLLLPSGAGILAAALSVLCRYVLTVAKTLSSFSLASVYTTSIYIVFWLGFVYLLLAVFLRQEKKRMAVLICCGTIGLCMALAASWLEPLFFHTRITMLDVGQGQSILLQSEGKTILVDCGGDSDTKTADIIAQTLLSQGIPRLDGIIVTHFDRDHAGSLHHLLTRIDTDLLFLPDTRNEMEPPETTGEIIYVWEDIELFFGSAKLTVFGPVYSGESNENSLCVLFDTQMCDILIIGDRSSFGERMLLRERVLPDVDVLVAGHHGAADSTSEELLQAVTPETVLISVGQDNFYGHPSDQLLQRLKEFGCTVYRTDLHGTITIRR